jgi:alkylhydroperoxidase family enzyme
MHRSCRPAEFEIKVTGGNPDYTFPLTNGPMIRWFFRRKLDAEEKKLGESMEYLRHIVDTSPTAFLRFASIMPFANSRKVLPKEAWYVAQIVSLQQEDCGPCLQITVNLAQKDRVDADMIRTVLDGNKSQLSGELADVYNFAQSIANSDTNLDALRESLRLRYGDRGLIELAYAIASSRIPPTVKRVLGYAKSCHEVTIKTTATPIQENVV